MIDYHKYVGYCRLDEKEKNRWEGVVGGGTKKNRLKKNRLKINRLKVGGTIQPIRPLGVEILIIMPSSSEDNQRNTRGRERDIGSNA